MKIVFIVNNKNNRLAGLLPGLERACRRRNLGRVQLLSTLRKKHAIELGKGATESGCDYLIAVGGDGTLHEVVNGVFRSNLPANLYPALGLLPSGSANDFARTAGISKAVEDLLDLIQSKSFQKIDLGKIIVHQTGETRYFINIAGAGFSPEVVQGMEGAPGVPGPVFTYFWHILKGFLHYTKKEVSCRSGTWQWEGPLLQLAVGNGRYFGHGICITPDAVIADGKFQVAVFGDLSLWDYLKNLGKLKKGEKIYLPEVHYHNGREVLLESKDACGIEADGEFVGHLPATLTVLPGALRFLMPPEME